METKVFSIQKFNPFIIISFLVFFSLIFFITSNFIDNKNKENESNFKEITKTEGFLSLINFLTSKISSPYEEINYVIKNNDTVEKILKQFKIRKEDITNISLKLKTKNLTNIYSGRKLSLILKKLEDGSNTIINFVYPINNTTSIEIRKYQNDFLLKENLYNFNYKNEQEYYDIKGKSITKSLMKTPINGARLSSSFGMRKHPILGYNKMHRGTDFAAPSGTPIMASGSGTVTRARWCGGGGNCVKIKHNSTYETIYAHMKAFAKGIREGKKVRQGQIIGYVGSTGLSTGPHLHYEVLVNGKKVNSQKLKLPSGKILKGDARKQFELDRIKTDLKLANLR